MTAKRVALVSLDAKARRALATYMTSVGFEVDERAELEPTRAYAGVVLVASDDTAADELGRLVASWMRSAKQPRVVVVTSKPSALRELALAHASRLHVLAAPAFGWDVVDALRARHAAPPPRGA